MAPDSSLAALLAADLELRAALLADAALDDMAANYARTSGAISYRRVEPHWPPFAALAELRLVERRIYQIREAMRD